MSRRLRRHVWVESTVKGKREDFCEACGRDKPADPAKAARADCRPTSIF